MTSRGNSCLHVIAWSITLPLYLQEPVPFIWLSLTTTWTWSKCWSRLAPESNSELSVRSDLSIDTHFVFFLIFDCCLGTFFLPRDQQRARPSKTTDYEGLAYFGEFPLAWAACCNNESAYNLLIDRGADPNSQDSFGNMVLHMVVVCDKLVSLNVLCSSIRLDHVNDGLTIRKCTATPWDTLVYRPKWD